MNTLSYNTFSEAITYNRQLESVVERMSFPKSIWETPFSEVFNQNSSSESFTLAILKAFDENENFPKDLLSTFPLEAILSYLRSTHCYYLEKKLPEIEQTFFNLIADYKKTHPELVRISSLFIDYKQELTHHIQEEENILFPYIDYLIKAKNNRAYRLKYSNFFKDYYLEKLEESHEDVESSLTNIHQLIHSYAPKTSSVMPFRVFLLQMDFFEKDLNRHAMMEDLVMMPLAKALESKIK
ncbi:MAG: hypothetical protein EAZ07_00770 [Cytophagales bacterium]|nr:MAG: hypothetical protein EAZ07_00770 [Cytophagales bacterium]